MKKEELPILIGLVLVGFFMLFILASSTSNLNLTGYVMRMEGFENQTSCEDGENVWYMENCYDEQPICAIDFLELCDDTNCDGVGYWYGGSCNEIPQPVCDVNNLDLCLDEENCTTLGSGYWYDGVCNVGAQTSCSNDLNLCNETNCVSDGSGYWYDDVCNVDEQQTCTEEWNCGGWSDCSGTSQTRTCTDTSDCGTEEDKPTETQECEVEEEEEPIEEEQEAVTTTETTTQSVEQIIAEMEATQTTSNEEEVEEQESSESLGEFTGGVVGDNVDEINCSEGCGFDEKCYDFNKRKNNSYCAEEGWIIQKEINVTCVEDFECLSNSCEEEKCGDYNWLRKFFDWVKDIFIKEIELNETQTIVSEEIIELEP